MRKIEEFIKRDFEESGLSSKEYKKSIIYQNDEIENMLLDNNFEINENLLNYIKDNIDNIIK